MGGREEDLLQEEKVKRVMEFPSLLPHPFLSIYGIADVLEADEVVRQSVL